MKSVVALLTVAGLGGLLAGCSDYRVRHTFTVDLTDAGQMQPASLAVPPGAQVTFHNAGLQPREVSGRPGTAPQHARPWTSGVLYPGETWARTFDRPGAYPFVSPYAPGFAGNASTGEPPARPPTGTVTVRGGR